MTVVKFDSADELFEYVVSHGPAVDPEEIEYLRGDEVADGIRGYFLEVMEIAPGEPSIELLEVVRENIRLVAGDEADFELADMVGAPWDCFA